MADLGFERLRPVLQISATSACNAHILSHTCVQYCGRKYIGTLAENAINMAYMWQQEHHGVGQKNMNTVTQKTPKFVYRITVCF